MSASIVRVLPENLANKIAAGEVVERPASIIKELVENSIDAGAKSIFIDLTHGGKRSIHVTDDGTGMNRDDALLAFERHATSKIRGDDDLFRICSLGFRGEALPSIASVAKVCMTTSTGEAGNGMKLWLEGGVMREVKEAAHPRGTSLFVNQLFFNTPARRKFMRTDQTELGHISNIATRQALARPEISFKINHNGRNLIDTPGHSELLPRIMDLFGRDIIDNLVPLANKKNGMEIEGYISIPHYNRAGKDSMYLYINKRHVKDKSVSHAVMEAYRTLLPKDRSPMVILFLKLDPASVDVNVHPAKTEVRFSNQTEVHRFIVESIREGLKSGNERSSFKDDQTPLTAPQVDHEVREAVDPILPDRGSSPGQADKPFPFLSNLKDSEIKKGVLPERSGARGRQRPPVAAFSTPTFIDASTIGYSGFRPLGQINRSYIVLEGKPGMILIDQHAAHERILYERFLREREKRSMETQQLLFPVSLELTKGEILLLDSIFKDMDSLGFELEPFGGNSVLVRSVPVLLSGKDYKTFLRDMFDKVALSGKRASFEEMAGDIIAVMACHASVRVGEELKPQEVSSLIEELKSTDRPYTCPHGRPIALFFDIKQMQSFFLRQ